MRNNEVKTPLGLRLRRRRSIGRWVRVLFLSVIAAIVFELILPPAWVMCPEYHFRTLQPSSVWSRGFCL